MTPAAAAVDLRRVRYPLRQPHVAAHGTEVERDLVLVAVTTPDGVVGWGECSALSRPTYTPEFTDGAWLVLRDHLAPALLDGRPHHVVGHPMARAAIATALLDAEGRRSGRPLAELLGGRAGRSVPTTTVVGLAGSVDEVLARVDAAPGAVKVKIRPGWDEAPLAAVRAAWPDRWLAADANGSYDPRDAAHRDALARLDELGLAYLEQPAPAEDLVGSAAVAEALVTPVALDECIDSPGAARAALALGAGSVVNVKPARVGGPAAAAAVVASAVEAGAGALVGGLLESGVGRAAALAVAGLAGCTSPADLGPSSRYVERDVVVPPIEAAPDGALEVPAGPGLGVEVDLGRVEDLTVERWIGRR